MTEEERARQNRRGQTTSRSRESLTGHQPESKSRWRSATQSTRDCSPSRQRSAVRGTYDGPQGRWRSALSTPHHRSPSRRRAPPREPEQAQPRTWRDAVEWKKGDKWICVVSQCGREEHTYSTYERLVDHFRTNHRRQVVLYNVHLSGRENVGIPATEEIWRCDMPGGAIFTNMKMQRWSRGART